MKPKPRRFCKDCENNGKVPRPAPHPGPRCATHHRAAVKASKAVAHEKRVQKVYGLAPGEYGRLYEFQGGRCAICERATGAAKKLSVDHDHKTGLVRGLLCGTCNKLLGHLRDDLETAKRVYSYLLWSPAEQLGIVAIRMEG